MASETKIIRTQLNPESLALDQELISLGYQQRIFIEVPMRNTYFSVFGLAHLCHCLSRPQVAAALMEREVSKDLKEALSYIANRQVDFAGAMSAQYIDYFLSPYQKLEASFTEGTEEVGKRLSDLFKVHIVELQHPGSEVKVRVDYTEGLAPILHLETVGTTYCALIPGTSEGFPLEGTQNQVQQHYFPELSYSQQSAEYIAPSSQQFPDSSSNSLWQPALNLIEAQLQIIKNLVQGSSHISIGEDTIQLLSRAKSLTEQLSLNSSEYQSIQSALRDKSLPAQPVQGAITVPLQQSMPTPKAVPNLTTMPSSSPSPQASSAFSCRVCANSEYSLLYLDGSHKTCQICFYCCAKVAKCPQCGRPYSESEAARFKVITRP